MSYNAIVLADSVSPAGHRVTTLEVTFPRFILAEFNTHRVLCRNSASSRAIPVAERIEQVKADPFVPEVFGKNKRGMSAEEDLAHEEDRLARHIWIRSSFEAVSYAAGLAEIGVHKQHANRLLEPFAWHTCVVTATEWENWDALRVSKLAQPEMYKIAGMMREVRTASHPLALAADQWHLPYVRDAGDMPFVTETGMRLIGVDPVKVSVGRCAAVSYERQSSKSEMQKDETRCGKLVTDGHMSPLEHALRPMTRKELDMFATEERFWYVNEFLRTGKTRYFLGPVEGWVQYRKLIPGEAVYRAPQE